MSVVIVDLLQTSIFSETLSPFDNCESLVQILETAHKCRVDIRSDAVCYFQEETVQQKTALQNSFAQNPPVSFTIASQSLTLSTLSHILKELMGVGTTVIVQENQFAKRFATIAIDVVSTSQVNIDFQHIKALASRFRTDIYLKSEATLNNPGLLVMDMDSTIIAMECIDEIADLAGVKPQVAAVTESAMRGEIPFTQSLHDRVACLKGVAIDDLLTIRNRLPFMPNFIETMRILKQANWTLAVASGGFTFFADYVKQIAGLDYASSNVLEVIDGKLTGRVIGEVVDGAAKAQVLVDLKQRLDVAATQVIAMGDGANDLLMMKQAGTSVAYHAKPSVSQQANVSIEFSGFEGLLFAIS